MAFTSAGVLAWAETVLQADATLQGLLPGGWWLGAAPPGVVTPCGTLNEPQPGSDLNTLYGVRWATDVQLQVSVFGPADDVAGITNLAAAAAQVDALLQRTTGGAAGTTALACVRQTSHLLPQPGLINGQQWYGVYQVYQVIAQ